MGESEQEKPSTTRYKHNTFVLYFSLVSVFVPPSFSPPSLPCSPLVVLRVKGRLARVQRQQLARLRPQIRRNGRKGLKAISKILQLSVVGKDGGGEGAGLGEEVVPEGGREGGREGGVKESDG